MEVVQGAPVILLGYEVAQTLFPEEAPLGKWVQVGRTYYRVIGVMARRGSLLGSNLDSECFIPWTTGRRQAPQAALSLVVGVPSVEEVPQAMQGARTVLRQVRHLRPSDPDNFTLVQGEMVAEFFLQQLHTVTLATIGISLLTLLGATLSLTNILLVVVKERTQEIGLRMAVGAPRKAILRQFLTEAVVISVLGGGGGILLGLLIGNGVAAFLGTGFVMPWRWVALATVISALVGILAGLQPAREAARLHPIDALRYE
uniref:ABC-2 type transport system permease protein n=1 Tax=uncultured Bacteroidota bacterium TaxID=152509 RepID=H5SNU7_9BACT|nr:ABC-2 type transport system permease protein [uncultured Bacteroidetes bacterium]